MDYKKLERLVNEQEVVSLALITPKGLPHNTPIWATYHDNAIYMFSRSSRAKAKYAAKNPNCMVAFVNGAVRGTIELIHRGTENYEKIMNIPDDRFGEDPNYKEYKANWDVAFKIIPEKLY